MDFEELALTNQAFYQFLHPSTGRPLFEQREVPIDPQKPELGMKKVDNPDEPVGVMLVSADTKEFREHLKRINDLNSEMFKKRKQRLNSDEQEREAMKTLAACIKEFRNVSQGSRPLTAPADCMAFVAEEKWAWAVEQIDRAIQDRGIFLKASAKN